MADINEIIAQLEQLNVLELVELTKAIQDKWGVSAAPVAVAAAVGAAGPAEAAPAEEEKTSFDAVLTAIGDKKIQVIKVLREVTALGLKEAKDLVEAGGKVKEAAAKAEAEEIKKKLVEAGAEVELV